VSNVERQILNEIAEQVRLREAAEARADELQRELDEALEKADHWYSEYEFQGHLAHTRHEIIEQARREADQLRAALRLVPIEEWQEWCDRAVLDMIEEEDMHAFLTAARAALAGSPSGPSEADQLRAALREISVLTPFNTPESASSVLQGPAIARAALAGVQADNKERA